MLCMKTTSSLGVLWHNSVWGVCCIGTLLFLWGYIYISVAKLISESRTLTCMQVVTIWWTSQSDSRIWLKTESQCCTSYVYLFTQWYIVASIICIRHQWFILIFWTVMLSLLAVTDSDKNFDTICYTSSFTSFQGTLSQCVNLTSSCLTVVFEVNGWVGINRFSVCL